MLVFMYPSVALTLDSWGMIVAGNLTVENETILHGSLYVDEDAFVGDDLDVSDDLVVSDDASLMDDLRVYDDLTVDGGGSFGTHSTFDSGVSVKKRIYAENDVIVYDQLSSDILYVSGDSNLASTTITGDLWVNATDILLSTSTDALPIQLNGNMNVTGNVTLLELSSPDGQVLCITSDGFIGTCSDQPSGDGSCTCT
ncbi:hypothetical protein ACFLRF_05280 [Candidatus Altiarchaeota archaeon]